MEDTIEQWKSPRRIKAEADEAYAEKVESRRQLRMKVGSSLADVVLSGLMTPKEAKKFYRKQFPEVDQS
jgi:hypothetical protein